MPGSSRPVAAPRSRSGLPGLASTPASRLANGRTHPESAGTVRGCRVKRRWARAVRQPPARTPHAHERGRAIVLRDGHSPTLLDVRRGLARSNLPGLRRLLPRALGRRCSSLLRLGDGSASRAQLWDRRVRRLRPHHRRTRHRRLMRASDEPRDRCRPRRGPTLDRSAHSAARGRGRSFPRSLHRLDLGLDEGDLLGVEPVLGVELLVDLRERL